MADHIGAIQFGLSHMGDITPSSMPELYSEIAHKSRKKRSTDSMSAQQIIGYIYNKL